MARYYTQADLEAADKRLEELHKQAEEMKRKTEILKAQYAREREEQEKKRQKRAVFDALFPEFKDVPIIWLIIGVVCVLFSLFTMII